MHLLSCTNKMKISALTIIVENNEKFPSSRLTKRVFIIQYSSEKNCMTYF